FEKAQSVLNKALGDRREGPLPSVVAAPAIVKGLKKVVDISDLHCPFVRLDQIAHICKQHSGADKLVISGDLDDGYAVSRFMKYQDVPYLKGLAYSKVVLEELSKHFAQIDLMEGNHDGPRFEKRLRAEVSGATLDAIEFLTGGELSPIRA